MPCAYVHERLLRDGSGSRHQFYSVALQAEITMIAKSLAYIAAVHIIFVDEAMQVLCDYEGVHGKDKVPKSQSRNSNLF